MASGSGGRVSRQLLRKTDNVDEFPIEALQAVAQIRVALNEIEREAIARARSKGATWETIAEALGVTRQAVYQRSHRADGRKPSLDGR